MRKPPKTVFLDQNKWIDLAHAFENPAQDREVFEIGCACIDALQNGYLQFPLTSGVIMETYKMGNDPHRKLIAGVQAKLSQGRVYRNRDFLIRHEVERFFSLEGHRAELKVPKFWWMSKYFLEAFVDIPVAVETMGLAPDQVDGLFSDPISALFSWVEAATSAERELAIGEWEAGAARLISEIDARRRRLKSEKQSMHRRVYAATLAYQEQARIISVCDAVKIDWDGISSSDPKVIKRIIGSIPTYQAEIALACAIESLDRPINPNDLRDMGSYVAAVPNSDIVVGEKLFVNLAIQGGMGKKYECELLTDIRGLKPYL